MLKYLHIENIAVIEKSDIEFSSGFNVLTGETGAGKSIIIDAINAVLGERTSKELIRAGCDTAQVSAVFGSLDPATIQTLTENGIEPDEDGNIVIFRRLSNTGKNIIRVNGVPVTAGILRTISKNLINIHGQHDNQSLLNPDNHYIYIDAVADDKNEIESYYSEFKRFNQIRRELNGIETDEDEKQRKKELLKYQIDELSAADIRIGEIQELKQRLTEARDFERNIGLINSAALAINGNDELDGVTTLLETAVKDIAATGLKRFDGAISQITDALNSLKATGEDLRRFVENEDTSEYDADLIGERLDLLQKFMRKYGDTEQKMLDYLENAQKALNDIEFSDERVLQLSEELDASTEKLVSLGKTLTKVRRKASEAFEKNVCKVLEYLNMPNVRFAVQFEKSRYTKNGCDNIEFLISANAGENLKPLHKIASGGELSRVMLAIKSVLANKDTVESLIFDEIDTGISGYAAGKVGIQLKRVSLNRQVICVTHLPQIAAMADNHLLISKSERDGKTFTDVSALEYNERVGEIARMMAGTELTENLFNSAKELLDRSLNDENL